MATIKIHVIWLLKKKRKFNSANGRTAFTLGISKFTVFFVYQDGNMNISGFSSNGVMDKNLKRRERVKTFVSIERYRLSK